MTQGTQPGLCDNLEVHKGGDIYTPMADMWLCMAETNTIL